MAQGSAGLWRARPAHIKRDRDPCNLSDEQGRPEICHACRNARSSAELTHT